MDQPTVHVAIATAEDYYQRCVSMAHSKPSERWRGRMPFRQNKRLWPEPLEQEGRGGEPSLANFRRVLDFARGYHEAGHGMARGSFTEHVRQELKAWLEKNGLTWHSPISFEYRLYRHKRVAITLTNPRIYHRRLRGDGSKGFVLEGTILSIDGLPPDHRYQIAEFALTRIVGRHPIRLLAEPKMPSEYHNG